MPGFVLHALCVWSHPFSFQRSSVQMRKQRHKNVKISAQCHTAVKTQSWDWNPNSLTPELTHLPSEDTGSTICNRGGNECKESEGVNNTGLAIGQSRVWTSALSLSSCDLHPSLSQQPLKCFFSNIPSQTCPFSIKSTSTNMDEMLTLARCIARPWGETHGWLGHSPQHQEHKHFRKCEHWNPWLFSGPYSSTGARITGTQKKR